MSPLAISGLVVAALFLVIGISYTCQIIEKHKLERARLRAELGDRLRRCANIADGLPGQMMSAPLKTMLTRLELHLCERLLPLERKNPAHLARLEALRGALGDNDEVLPTNPPVQIASEAQAKQVRLLLEDLHALVLWAARQRQLDEGSASYWLGEVQRRLVQLHIEFFDCMGKQALRRQPQKARLIFERAVQYLRKQPAFPEQQAQIKAFSTQIEAARQAELLRQQPDPDEPSELTEGLKNLEDDDWKKNQIY